MLVPNLRRPWLAFLLQHLVISGVGRCCKPVQAQVVSKACTAERRFCRGGESWDLITFGSFGVPHLQLVLTVQHSNT